MFLPSLLLTLAHLNQAANPIEFGREELARVAGEAARSVRVTVVRGMKKEAYRVEHTNGTTMIVAGDEVGAMYGELDLAERIKKSGPDALKVRSGGTPYLIDRGVNLFLTLPWNYKKNDTDYELAALTDPDRWWFHNENYWNTLFDLMAKSRLNWLDIHGSWDISSTGAPNMYAYFVTSPSFPKVGVPEDIKTTNLRQLNHVIEMAHARGIRVSLMCYEANLRIPQNPNPGYAANEANIYRYTAEVVEKMVRGLPKLDAIGFRIGESGHSESFFSCYNEGLKKAGRDIPLVTRSWITRKQKVLPLARASKDFTVEIKYNGEQWGAPYPVMGGRMANWSSYSFEDYFSDSGAGGEKMWQGNPTPDGKRWPAQPYKVVWQVRANGTHRIFPFYNPEWTRRSILGMKLGTVSGYTIEGEDAYFPKAQDYYLRDPKDKYCDWIHQRDEMYWMCWGRLGYDPETPESVFDDRANELTHGKANIWKQASIIVPKAYMAFSLGPDHRNHAPELEWGGDMDAFLHGQGFDSFVNEPVDEYLANRHTKGQDSRDAPAERASNFARAVDIRPLAGSFTGREKELQVSTSLEIALGHYYWLRLNAALRYAETAPADLERYEAVDFGARDYGKLASSSFYRPFTDRLRMHTNTFTWASEMKKVEAENKRKTGPATTRYGAGGNGAAGSRGAILSAKLQWRAVDSNIEYAVATSEAEHAWLLVKPLPSSTFFHRVVMQKRGNVFSVELPRERCGTVFAVDLQRGHESIRFPDVESSTPYIVVPATPGPTPQIYNAEEAIRFLKPEKIDVRRYGAILVGSRASNFWLSNDRVMKRKLLEPVAKGLKLVILQQDFNKYKLDWMPKPLALEAFASDVLEPGRALGLRRVTAPGLIWQRFAKSDGWDLHGNGAIASMKYGKGEIWVTTARLMQNMHTPTAAQAFVDLLGVGGRTKPTILVDSCSEGGEFTSSCHPDLMNSHDIPFLTLGEVVAKEQGMDEYTTVAGPVNDDDVLNGKGEQLTNAVLMKQVQVAAARAIPTTRAELDADRGRRKSILMKSLGLDPMPARTPLNAKITGSVQRQGYRIEKLVFESRPGFFVTAHVYVPDVESRRPTRFPVIVHVNGHWAHKKAEDRLQLRNAICALNGYITICIDTPGHSFEGNSLIERREEGDHNDFKLVEGGSNTTGYYVWDAMRALDYMTTRNDTNMRQVGITGASGGGLAALFIFAADDRYKAAVPVVYMSSMELAPDNGCLCNHVPGLNQIGDKSDVLSIQAPKPVYIMGAQNDGEFPPDAMRLTHSKVKQIWSLYGKGDDTFVQVYAGGHDYNQPMRESMVGFFNKYVRGIGDGSPVKQTDITIYDPEDRSFLVLDPPLPERTMRDLSKEYLDHAPKDVSARDAIDLNGGIPKTGDTKYRENGTGPKRTVTFESEPGLVTPGVLVLPAGTSKGVRIVANDKGKAAAIQSHNDGFAYLYLDVLGTGELGTLEMRYPVYLGRSVAFIGGHQMREAAMIMAHRYSTHIEFEGDGPLASQAAMWAGLMSQPADDSREVEHFHLDRVTGSGCLREWKDVFADSISDYAVQPRAHLMGTLENLRRAVKNSTWHLR